MNRSVCGRWDNTAQKQESRRRNSHKHRRNTKSKRFHLGRKPVHFQVGLSAVRAVPRSVALEFASENDMFPAPNNATEFLATVELLVTVDRREPLLSREILLGLLRAGERS